MPDNYQNISEFPAGSAPNRFKTQNGQIVEIRDVWMSNLDIEMENIRNIIEKYPYVAMVNKNMFD